MGLGVHEPYNDNYVYRGNAETNRFSGQWIKHEAKGYLPWCYTYGKCVGDYGLDFTTHLDEAPRDSCGYWQYLTGADRSMTLGGARALSNDSRGSHGSHGSHGIHGSHGSHGSHCSSSGHCGSGGRVTPSSLPR